MRAETKVHTRIVPFGNIRIETPNQETKIEENDNNVRYVTPLTTAPSGFNVKLRKKFLKHRD